MNNIYPLSFASMSHHIFSKQIISTKVKLLSIINWLGSYILRTCSIRSDVCLADGIGSCDGMQFSLNSTLKCISAFCTRAFIKTVTEEYGRCYYWNYYRTITMDNEIMKASDDIAPHKQRPSNIYRYYIYALKIQYPAFNIYLFNCQ